MCQKIKAEGKTQDKIDDLIDNVNDVFLALASIRVHDEDSRRLRQEALVSTIIIRANLEQLKIEY